MKRLLSVAMLLCVVIVLLSALSLKTTEAKAPPSSLKLFQNRYSSTSCNWSVVPSPNGNSNSVLSGVAAVSANDVWAVGSDSNSNFVTRSLTEQWNGKQWSVVKSPSPGSFSTQLEGVAAVSATDVWAVGHTDSNTLIEHYHC